MKMNNSSRSFSRPTTNTGRSMELQQWPSAMSWMPQLRNGLITCCRLTPCSTVRPAMERMSSPCMVQLASLSQVRTCFFSAHLYFHCFGMEVLWIWSHLTNFTFMKKFWQIMFTTSRKKNQNMSRRQLTVLFKINICICILWYWIGKEAVESWYSEIKDYKWSSPGFSGNTGN